jgi:mannitol/fructose-specific phosphotransferase system IIA component (Ntr-type)
MIMNLANFIDKNVVKVPVESLTRDEVIAELVELLVRSGKIDDRQSVLDALYERESRGSTGIGGGVAIPHARCEGIDQTILAVGVAPDGIEFEAVDDEPVKIVFLLLGSPSKPGQTIEALADIGILVQIPQVYDALVNASSPEDVVDVIQEAQNGS